MRLIDADALKDGMMENINPYLGIYESGEPRSFVREDEVLRYIDGFPTIDPVKHGKWIVIPKRCENQTFDECKCSVCGTVEYFNSGWKKFSYCPNCGAKMEQEDEDER